MLVLSIFQRSPKSVSRCADWECNRAIAFIATSPTGLMKTVFF